MELLHALGDGLGLLLQFDVLLLILIGTAVGICVGAIPGLSATMAIAMAVPITYSLGAMQGLALLIAVYVGGLTGGLVSAILLNIPGTPSSIATTFDGYPMAAKGEPGKALGYAIVASFLGGGFSYLCLLFIAPNLAALALGLSSFEIFTIIICALVMIADTSQTTLSKAIASGLIGMFIGCVGPDPIMGTPRFAFGMPALGGGFVEITVLIALFAVPQVLNSAREKDTPIPPFQLTYKHILPKISELKASLVNLVRSSFLGTLIGIVPGVGANTASLLAYNQAKLASKHPERFGQGEKEGIIASEASNNAVTGGAMVPLLTLGLPGCPAAALLLSGLIINDLQPGPQLFTNNPDITYGFIFAFMLANLFVFCLMLILIKPFAMALRIPKYLLLPPILIICTMGAYITNSREFDLWVLLGFGLFGYFAEKNGYALAPMVLGLILAPIAEMHLRRGLTASKGSFMPLLERPVALLFICIAILMVSAPFIRRWYKKRKLMS